MIVLLCCLGIKYRSNNISASDFMNRSVIANWKMHFSLKEAVEFCATLDLIRESHEAHEILRSSPKGGSNIIIAASTPYLAHLSYLFPHIAFAAQDVSVHESCGAHTGEASSSQLVSCGVSYCIIGHPERRRDFGESDEIVKRKADSCIKAGLVPIICLGDDISLAKEFKEGCMIAYEPKESIGTGVIPDSKKLEEVFGELKSMVAKSVNLVYGGSVNSSNLSAIKSACNIDSILLGGAALRAESLKEILKNW